MKRGPKPHPDILTPREWEVLSLIREGLSNEAIAARLGISIDGVKYHVSEILSKLGVRDRLEAARWQPEEEGRPPAWLPLGAWARGLPLKVLGAALAAGVAAALGVLIWGLVTTRGGDDAQPSVAAEPTPTPVPPAVLIFDTEAGRVGPPPGKRNITFATWLVDGETFLAYDIDARAWKVYDVNGAELRTLVAEPASTAPYVMTHPHPSANGNVLVLNGMAIDAATLTASPLLGPPGANVNHMLSPDGRHLVFTNEQAGQSSLVLGSLGEAETAVLRSATLPDDWSIPIAWSPDGSRLLIESNEPGSSALVYEVIDLDGTPVRRLDVPPGPSPSAQWAGPERILIDQWPDPIVDLSARANRHVIRIADGSELPVSSVLDDATLFVSPDGRYAIARRQDRSPDAGRYDQRCGLVALGTGAEIASVGDLPAGYCGTVDWTADGRFAIVTGGGN